MLRYILSLSVAAGLAWAPAHAQNIGLGNLKSKAKGVITNSQGNNSTAEPATTPATDGSDNADMNADVEKQMAAYACEPSSGAFHDAHKGQVVFATAKIERGAPESAGIKSSFTTDEHIYARAYLEKCMAHYAVCEDGGYCYANVTTAGSSFFVTYTIDGKGTADDGSAAMLIAMDVNANDKNQYLSTFNFPVIGTEESGGSDDDLVAALNKLSPGEHTLHLDVWAGIPYVRHSAQPMAMGDLKLVKKAGGGSMKLGRTFSGLEAGMTDPALETKMLAAAKRRAKAEGWKETPSKVKISDTGWSIQRNENTGVILGRTISAWVYATWPDGHCTYQDFGFHEEYDGSSYADNPIMEGVGAQTTCDCE